MICPQCRTPMREQRRTFHKKRKWVCPRCNKVRMQGGKPAFRGTKYRTSVARD